MKLSLQKPVYKSVPSLCDLLFVAADFKDRFFEKHFHDHYVFGFNLAGAHDFYFHRHVHTLGTDRIVVIPPGEIHTGISHNHGAWQYRAIYPDPAVITYLLGEDRAKNLRIEAPYVSSREARYHLQQATKYLIANDIDLAEDSLILFFLALDQPLTALISHLENSSPPDVVKRVTEYLHDHSERQVRLDALEEEFAYSKYHLVRLFKQYVGVSPTQFHRSVRLSRSFKRLLQTKDIVQTALDLDFYDQSHFTNHFKKFYGFTPYELLRSSSE